eukprot:CAMPEP_0184646374 /NCGR_PEP_ID=MMETSP0308-20130426/3070_1 /TAXON_ID=38269 /ORGANISM="Gloeochaete witrockiana, Strain SAG 46.84" /LENGTH=66 /DNA_ID=CAMNT_0027076333 /DNA_START=333 /DNA_END=530 /DNA_ORIENTATION=-
MGKHLERLENIPYLPASPPQTDTPHAGDKRKKGDMHASCNKDFEAPIMDLPDEWSEQIIDSTLSHW